MVYKVLKIEEDLDFGCEERSERSPVMAVLTLLAEDGKERTFRAADRLLYEEDVKEGDLLTIHENGRFEKSEA